MIDYEMLRFANSLADEISKSRGFCVNIFVKHSPAIDREPSFGFGIYDEQAEQFYSDIDQLISALQELLHNPPRQPKYKIGDYAWHAVGGKVRAIYITDIDEGSDQKYLDDFENWWKEEQLYPSREALINAQLEYWNTQLEMVGETT